VCLDVSSLKSVSGTFFKIVSSLSHTNTRLPFSQLLFFSILPNKSYHLPSYNIYCLIPSTYTLTLWGERTSFCSVMDSKHVE
jgi:hypothetical protein